MITTEDKNIIKNIILFLEENEQYGDNWKNEIKVLNKIFDEDKTVNLLLIIDRYEKYNN